jgi:hypothetical protein
MAPTPTLRAMLCAWMFAPASPVNLAVCRIVVYGTILLYLVTKTYVIRNFDAPWLPVSYYRLLGLSPLNRETYFFWLMVLKISLLCCTLGFFTRTNCLLSFLLGWYLIGLPVNFGKVGHGSVLLLFALAGMAFSRCGDALSLDAWWQWRRHKTLPCSSGEYTWPLRFFQMMFCLVFMGAGLTKLRVTGWDWIATDNMQNILLMHFYCGNQPLLDWGRWISQIPWLCQTLAAITVFAEISAPLALIHRWPRMIIIPTLFGMQIGILLLMGVFDFNWIVTYVFWIPWDRLLSSATRLASGLFSQSSATCEVYGQAH